MGKIHKVLDKNNRAEMMKRELEAKRHEQQELRREQQRLKLQDKLDNVERYVVCYNATIL